MELECPTQRPMRTATKYETEIGLAVELGRRVGAELSTVTILSIRMLWIRSPTWSGSHVPSLVEIIQRPFVFESYSACLHLFQNLHRATSIP